MYLFRLYIFILSLAAGAALMFAAPLAAQTPSAAALTEDPLPDGRARVVVEAADTTAARLCHGVVHSGRRPHICRRDPRRRACALLAAGGGVRHGRGIYRVRHAAAAGGRSGGRGDVAHGAAARERRSHTRRGGNGVGEPRRHGRVDDRPQGDGAPPAIEFRRPAVAAARRQRLGPRARRAQYDTAARGWRVEFRLCHLVARNLVRHRRRPCQHRCQHAVHRRQQPLRPYSQLQLFRQRRR